jgi:hypothetical protein
MSVISACYVCYFTIQTHCSCLVYSTTLLYYIHFHSLKSHTALTLCTVLHGGSATTLCLSACLRSAMCLQKRKLCSDVSQTLPNVFPGPQRRAMPLTQKTFVSLVISRSLNYPLPSICSFFPKVHCEHNCRPHSQSVLVPLHWCLYLFASCLACGKRHHPYNSRPSVRIVGGSESAPGDWPFLAALLGGPEEVFYCAGVIISDQWVLTASHCVGK